MCWCLLTAYEKAYGMKDATSNKPGADLHRDDGLSAFSNLSNYRAWDLKIGKLIDFWVGLEPCHRFDDRVPNTKLLAYLSMLAN